jgi:hypothetical protein
MQTAREVLKTAAVALSIVVLTPAIHSFLGLMHSFEATIAGDPIIPRLMAVVCVQAFLLVTVFKWVRADLPASRGWTRGLVFGCFFLLAVQIPSVFGIIAFEPGADWMWFTEAKLANYITLAGDTLVFLLIGALIGALFPTGHAAPVRRGRIPWLAMVVGAVVFPASLWAIVHAAFAWLPVLDPNAPVDRSLWFDLVFYGAFFLTGLCLPLLHAVAGRAAGWREVLRSAGLFALLWLPVQNFMVVFGWEVGGALFFSTLSMGPVLLVLWLSDRLIPRG